METSILCPPQLKMVARDSSLSLVAGAGLEKGDTFHPWQGDVNTKLLAPFPLLAQFELKHRFGLHDEIKQEAGKLVRHCNWVRFLKTSLLMGPDVNIVGRRSEAGEPVFEMVQSCEPGTELVGHLLPPVTPGDIFLPAIQMLRQTIIKVWPYEGKEKIDLLVPPREGTHCLSENVFCTLTFLVTL